MISLNLSKDLSLDELQEAVDKLLREQRKRNEIAYQRQYQKDYRAQRLIELIEKRSVKKPVHGAAKALQSKAKEVAERQVEKDNGYFTGMPETVCRNFGCGRVLNFRELLFGQTCLQCS